MGALLLALAPLLSGITQPLKDWFAYKQQVAQKEQDYKLALLQSQVEAAKSESLAQSSDLKTRLEATTMSFKQSTFWLLFIPIGYSMIFPKQAEIMWHNFSLIPDYFQWLFLSVYSSIWGIPIVKGGYGAVTDLLQTKREYKLQKAAIDRKAVFSTLTKLNLFPKGFTQEQVDVIDKALDAGENTL